MNMACDWAEWTPCQFYGHKFVDGSCVDCGEVSEPDEEVAGHE